MPTETVIDRDLVTELTRQLIRFPSVNPPGNEEEIARWLGGRMENLGLEVEIEQLEPNRANAVGRLRGAGSSEGHLVFTGHLDVVPPGGQTWEHSPFDADLVDGRIYGRGSADMKGGVASIVAAVAALRASDFRPSADIVIACTAGEEAGMMGAQAMVERRSLEGSRYLVVAEPTDLDVFTGEKGVLWLRVRAWGRTAHGSMPSLGINAISAIARLIPRLEDYPFPYEESPLLGKPTLSANVIGGGNKTNVVPDLCELWLDMRTVPSQDHDHLLAAVRSLATEVAHQYDPHLRIEVDVDNNQSPLETDRNDPLATAISASVYEVRGVAPSLGGVSYGTDAAHLGPGFGMPMVICGPGAPGMAHQPNEHVEVEQLVQAAEIYADLARRLLG